MKLFSRVHRTLLVHMCGAVTYTPLNVHKDSFTAAIVAQRRRNLKKNKVKQYQIPSRREDNLKSFSLLSLVRPGS